MVGRYRKFLVGGNWKMNGTKPTIDDIVKLLNHNYNPKTEVVIAPPAPYLSYVRDKLDPRIGVAAQNCYKTANGAYTGELSPDMLRDIGVSWAIIGHSERRSIFKETDLLVGEKTAYALSCGLSVMPCIGETKEERNNGFTNEVLFKQLESIHCFNRNPWDWSRMAIAYEPVWAIGAGVAARPEEAQEVHKAVRNWIADNVCPTVAKTIRILYGGSVSADNCRDLVKMCDVDGFLVGGVSLKPDFVHVINATS